MTDLSVPQGDALQKPSVSNSLLDGIKARQAARAAEDAARLAQSTQAPTVARVAEPVQAPPPVTEPLLTFTRWADATQPGQFKVEQMTWSQVREQITGPKEWPRKKAAPLFKLARFDGARSNDGLVEISGIEGDYDAAEVSIEEAAGMLQRAGIEALLVSSGSHMAAKQGRIGPRWRVVCPLSAALPRDRQEGLVALLNGALGGILGDESFVASQTYFYGRVAGVQFEHRHVPGAPLDVVEMLGEVEPIGKRGGQAAAPAPAAAGPTSARQVDAGRQHILSSVTPETLADVQSALAALPLERATDYNLWIETGEALYSLCQAGYEAQASAMWHMHSGRASDYDQEVAEAKWGTFAPVKITFRSIFEWAQQAGWVNPRSAAAQTSETRKDRSDAGNVAHLAELTAGDLRFVPETKAWLKWADGRWNLDAYGTLAQDEALRVAEAHEQRARDLQAQADAAVDAGEKKKLAGAANSVRAWAVQCRNKGRLSAMLEMAGRDRRFALPRDQLDRDPWLFGADNGVIDLRTGELVPSGRDDLVTKRTVISYDPSMISMSWIRFVMQITALPREGGGVVWRPALARYLQRALGYSMTGVTREHKMFFAIGAGANGKSVLLETVEYVMGNYAERIAADVLMAGRTDLDAERPTPGARKLAGARAVISSESKEHQKLDVGLVKRHTGDSKMTARGLHENGFTFDITHKVWLMTNHVPKVDHLDDALRGRLHMIPFDMRWNRAGHSDRVPGRPDGDKGLAERLRAEAQGILTWLVAGAMAYDAEGLEPPEDVARFTRAYFHAQDAMGEWLEQFERCEPRHGSGAADLFSDFNDWCRAEEREMNCPSQVAFSNKLTAMGVEGKKTEHGKRYGLRKIASTDAVSGRGG